MEKVVWLSTGLYIFKSVWLCLLSTSWPYTHNKLQFRSVQSVFLSYSSRHRGYKCMYLGSSWIYIARNVIFDEITVPCAHNKISLLASNTSHSWCPTCYFSKCIGFNFFLCPYLKVNRPILRQFLLEIRILIWSQISLYPLFLPILFILRKQEPKLIYVSLA